MSANVVLANLLSNSIRIWVDLRLNDEITDWAGSLRYPPLKIAQMTKNFLFSIYITCIHIFFSSVFRHSPIIFPIISLHIIFPHSSHHFPPWKSLKKKSLKKLENQTSITKIFSNISFRLPRENEWMFMNALAGCVMKYHWRGFCSDASSDFDHLSRFSRCELWPVFTPYPASKL